MAKELTDHELMRKRLEALQRRHARHQGKTKDLEDERSRLYVEARELDPPMTFREIADIFGVTEAAVMQKTKRHSLNNS